VHYLNNNLGRVLINIGDSLIDFFEISKTENKIYFLNGSQTWCAKVLSQKGNSPDHWLKTLNKFLV